MSIGVIYHQNIYYYTAYIIMCATQNDSWASTDCSINYKCILCCKI